MLPTKYIAFFFLSALFFEHATAHAQNSENATFGFDHDEADKLPVDWAAASGTWMIAADGTNKAMKQAGKNQGDSFNVCVQSKIKYQNLDMEVRIKPLEGKEDQGGGLVWRYQNIKNYYVARANPLENNLIIYKVVNGIRKEIKSTNVKIKIGEWYKLKVVMIGYTLDCYFNGDKLLNATDKSFPNAGQIGFWSKADAISLFDDLKVKKIH